ncbi:peptidase M50 [Mycobacterium sp. E740]|uniref:peptidase M50 n=1 Tax=Mycobacterium sp. E740 TaxID=1834149 RepID=UPI0007FB739D|nr:peptidase M50 [Mycobacterium sp. E740]OBI76139.1 peptidase M50 [Mycobacterium sp. E740]
MNTTDAVVLVFGDRRPPRPLRGLPVAQSPDEPCRRLIVVGSDADLATVLTRLLRTDRLGVEVAHVRRRWQARRALRGSAGRVPLIRDDAGTVVVGAAYWLGHPGGQPVHGEAVVDDTVLFDGDAPRVRIEPTATMPGLRAAVSGAGRRRWVAGRAAQLGTTGAVVVRDGVPAVRPVKRSTFYRHTEGWLRVR